MANERFGELDRINRLIDAVRADPERVGELLPLLDARAGIKAEIDASADPAVEIAMLERNSPACEPCSKLRLPSSDSPELSMTVVRPVRPVRQHRPFRWQP